MIAQVASAGHQLYAQRFSPLTPGITSALAAGL